MELVEAGAFLYRHQAELAKGLLEQNGIRTVLSADDCGGYRPHLHFTRPYVRLMVTPQDQERARALLSARPAEDARPEPAREQEEDSFPEESLEGPRRWSGWWFWLISLFVCAMVLLWITH
ncbi:MAG: hypothetical protein GF333_00775 [Candidatus Omnitrophica bacterium]|nr:hypothetical protein [Candidatus Omnitrophota bacterium]